MDVLATVRQLLVAIIILLCAGSAPAISTPTAGALYSQIWLSIQRPGRRPELNSRYYWLP